MAAPARGRLAAHRRPVLRRPRAVGARRPGRLAGGGPRAAEHRPDGLLRRHRRQLVEPVARLDARRGRPLAADRGRSRRPPIREDMSDPRGCRAGRARRPRHRRRHPAREPHRRAHPEPARAAPTATSPTRSCGWSRPGDFPSTSSPTGMRRGAPRVGDGVIHLDADGPGQVRQPERRVGRAPDGSRRRRHRRGAGRRSSPTWSRAAARTSTSRWRSSRPGGPPGARRSRPASATITMRAIPLTARRGAHRGAGAAARRVRAAPARARAAHQGRDDPRDPPPGEEQPADRRGPAAAAGPAGRPTTRRGRALEEAVRRVGTIALVHETLSQGFDETRELRRDRRARAAGGGRGGRPGSTASSRPSPAASAGCAPRTPPRWR